MNQNGVYNDYQKRKHRVNGQKIETFSWIKPYDPENLRQIPK